MITGELVKGTSKFHADPWPTSKVTRKADAVKAQFVNIDAFSMAVPYNSSRLWYRTTQGDWISGSQLRVFGSLEGLKNLPYDHEKHQAEVDASKKVRFTAERIEAGMITTDRITTAKQMQANRLRNADIRRENEKAFKAETHRNPGGFIPLKKISHWTEASHEADPTFMLTASPTWQILRARLETVPEARMRVLGWNAEIPIYRNGMKVGERKIWRATRWGVRRAARRLMAENLHEEQKKILASFEMHLTSERHRVERQDDHRRDLHEWDMAWTEIQREMIKWPEEKPSYKADVVLLEKYRLDKEA